MVSRQRFLVVSPICVVNKGSGSSDALERSDATSGRRVSESANLSPAIEFAAAFGRFLPIPIQRNACRLCHALPQFVKLQTADWSRHTDLCRAESWLTNLQTVARDTPCFLATRVRLKPVRRSLTIAIRSTSSGARPMRRPSSLARRMPARTRSTIKERSSSAIAAMITTIALPSGPSVSIASRCERNWIPRSFQLVENLEEVLGGSR